ncbi:MAG TPA: serine hydrolase domain-containing protein [Candidatus Dormibacteraeota bacterium]|nr:serine hydrolase domain-containing protein [Candidatus Dormibacteraeota bacterium]
MFRRMVVALACFAIWGFRAIADQRAVNGNTIAKRIDSYLKPYVQSGNFSGAVLAKENGKTVLEKAYGFADREQKTPNSVETHFHIASVSMQFTAGAILRLVDEGKLNLETHAGEFVPGMKGAEKITVRDLLTERSGLPDINNLPDYDEILQHHQTPSSLVTKIQGQTLLFEPGTKFLHEEHSAYNLLALIVEKKTGLPFASAVKGLVFRPAHLETSGIDDDSSAGAASMAVGYQPAGVYGLSRAAAIHWSGKTGNASAFTTVGDETKWVEALFEGQLLSAPSREAMLDTSLEVGYGWFKRANKRFGETAYYMNGRAPGFGSFVLYLPREKTSVVLFSNIYSSATTTIGYDVAAIVRGLPYETFHPSDPPPSAAELKTSTGTFQFGSDFYQSNAQLTVITEGQGLLLRWPGASLSALIPVGRDQFMDRSYWEPVKLERDAAGQPTFLAYGSFRGAAVSNKPH